MLFDEENGRASLTAMAKGVGKIRGETKVEEGEEDEEETRLWVLWANPHPSGGKMTSCWEFFSNICLILLRWLIWPIRSNPGQFSLC